MKTAGGPLIAYLNAAQGADAELSWWWLLTLTLADGNVYRWTTCDQNITVGGNSYGAATTIPTIHVGKIRQVIGVELCEAELTLGRSFTLKFDGIYFSLPLAAANGSFDNATIEFDKLFARTPGDVGLGVLKYFVGLVCEVKASSSKVVLTCRGSKQLLKTLQWPKRRLMPQCPYSLYDADCGVSKGAGTGVTIVAGTLTTTVVTVSGLAHGAYVLGTIQFADGEIRQIQSMANSGSNDVLTLNVPLAALPSLGDTPTVWQGCNKSLTTLSTNSGNCATFGNSSNFGGFPFVPRPESIR